MKITPVSFTELLPLQILYIFVSPLSAVGHNTSILVVGSFHHTSRSIHLASFTISNRLYWIGLLSSSSHLHLKYWFTILSTGWFITVITSFCGWSSGNGETKIQKCAKINNKWNRKFKINTFFFLDHIASQFHWIVTFTNSLHFCFTTVSCWS